MAEGWKTGGLLKGPGIPAPSGQYRVGCADLMCQLEGDDKGLLVRLHYPTEATAQQGYQYSNWYPHKNYVKGSLSVSKPKFSGVVAAILNGLIAPKSPALEGAPLLGSKSGEKDPSEGTPVDPEDSQPAAAPAYPVIVFSHGLGAYRTIYTGIVCDLVSHGYVIACVEHRDRSAGVTFQRVPKVGGREGELQDQWVEYQYFDTPIDLYKVDPVGSAKAEFPHRNKQVKIRADDVKKTLDLLILLNEGAEIKNMLDSSYDFKQFKGRLEVSTAAVMGHSFGGGTTVQTLYEDKRFKCGLALDGWQIPLHEDVYSTNTSISQPLYFINAYYFQWQENMKRMLPLTRPPDADGVSTCRVLTVKGTGHLFQTDVPFTLPRAFGRALVKGPLPPDMIEDIVAYQVNRDVCHAFFKRYLLNDASCQSNVPNLDGTEGHSEHLLFGTNVDMSETQSHLNNETGVASAGEEGVASTEGGVASAGEEGVASTEGGVVPAGEEGVASAGEEGVASTEGASIELEVEDEEVERREGKREGKGGDEEEGGLVPEQGKAED